MRLFFAASTQLNIGFNGVVGLRYEALPMLREAHGITPAEWPAVFECLQALERRALEIWRDQAAQKR